MKNLKLPLLAFTLVIFNSCENVKVEKEIGQGSTQEQRIEESENAEVKSAYVDSLVAAINTKRVEIENSVSDPIAVSTSDLREKIKQKWEKIHFYTTDGSLVRIKTYPYENITKRTEEFYLENGELILAVIEDDGTGARGKSLEDFDKLYYFADGELIHEVHKSEEREYSLRKSDAEELQTEVREYLDIYQSRSKD